MKKLLTIILLAVVVGGKAQTKDSLYSNENGIIRWSKDTSLVYMIPSQISTYATNCDTVKVIMLVCDTVKTIYTQGDMSGEIERKEWYPFANARWQYGYQITKHEYWKFPLNIGYLDYDRKPLPKTTVVWMSKEIK